MIPTTKMEILKGSNMGMRRSLLASSFSSSSNYCPYKIFAYTYMSCICIDIFIFEKIPLQVEYKLEMAHGYVKKGEEPRFNYDQYCGCHVDSTMWSQHIHNNHCVVSFWAPRYHLKMDWPVAYFGYEYFIIAYLFQGSLSWSDRWGWLYVHPRPWHGFFSACNMALPKI